MKTLVIHPKDSSTDFLKPIYEGIEDKTVVNGGVTKQELHDMISNHDRVIMLGHGCPLGLFSCGQFKTTRGTIVNKKGEIVLSDKYNLRYGLIIDSESVELLSEKKDNVYIWCNADEFVNKYELKGFYSGMFVSEVGESIYCNVRSSQEVVDENNNEFSKILGKHINNPTEIVHRNVTLEFDLLSESNIVVKYNCERLYKRVENVKELI